MHQSIKCLAKISFYIGMTIYVLVIISGMLVALLVPVAGSFLVGVACSGMLRREPSPWSKEERVGLAFIGGGDATLGSDLGRIRTSARAPVKKAWH